MLLTESIQNLDCFKFLNFSLKNISLFIWAYAYLPYIEEIKNIKNSFTVIIKDTKKYIKICIIKIYKPISGKHGRSYDWWVKYIFKKL